MFFQSLAKLRRSETAGRETGVDENKKPSLDLADIDVDQLFTAVKANPLQLNENYASNEPAQSAGDPSGSDALDWDNSQDDDLLSLHSELSKLGRPNEAMGLETDSMVLSQPQTKWQRLVLLTATSLLLISAAYFVLLPGNFDFAASLFNFGSNDYASFSEPKMTSESSIKTAREASTPEQAEPEFAEGLAESENPYLPLPNEIIRAKAASPSLSARKESEWRSGLVHRFNFQRYKTAKKIRQEESLGAKALLIKVLDQSKFWTRMQGVIGLAELGEPLDLIYISKALGDANSYLVWRYLKRFENRKLSGGELHVIRSMLRLVDRKSRVRILGILHQMGGEINSMYLLAARSDVDPKVQKWAKTLRPKTAITPELHQKYNSLVAEYKGSERHKEEMLVTKTKAGQTLVEAIDVDDVDDISFIKAVGLVKGNTDQGSE